MKEVICPHCSFKFMPGIMMCSNPFQTYCPKCHKRFYLDTDGHSAIDSSDIPGNISFDLNAGVIEEIGGGIHNPNLSKVKIEVDDK